MSLQTPRQRGLQRPSYGNGSSPTLGASLSTAVNRKASLQALTGQSEPKTPLAADGELGLGEQVNVPGDMYGLVKFIGSVKGKSGKFVGVELDKEFAARGKNSGDVDGTSYFTTTIPGAGIFLPVHRAERRFSPGGTLQSPTTPGTPSHSTANGQQLRDTGNNTPPTPALPHKLAQSVGPGVRPPSPSFKPQRPSLPRPESPLRKQTPTLAPTPARTLSQSQRGTRPSQSPSKTNLKASNNMRPPASTTSRPYSRSGSRLGSYSDDIPEDERAGVGIATTTNGRAPSAGSGLPFSQPPRAPSRTGGVGGSDAEVQRLKSQLVERDRRLEEQAASLADMERSVKELSAILPQDPAQMSGSRSTSLGENDDATSAQLRQMIREKNEKISMLTTEFDAHRADFRSTLDSLEMASTETERVYEEQKRDLLAQIADLQDMGQSKEDFEGVARQLKQLEELVAELEEGLEESRRGEAEARGEVEFLRGEVERGRSELKRERDKAAAADAALRHAETTHGSPNKEIEAKDDEIRGLKAIIHGLSSNPHAAAVNTDGEYSGEGDVKKLRSALDQSEKEREELERELEQLRRDSAVTNGNGSTAHTRNESERTATGVDSRTQGRPRADTVKATFANRMRSSHEAARDAGNAAPLFCDMCGSDAHDTLDCNNIHSERDDHTTDAVPKPLYSPGKENENVASGINGKASEDKWCALCEKDGHLAFDCPEEQY